jgi:hypothetical protein
MKDNYRGIVCAGILGCILGLLATPLLAQKPATSNTIPVNAITTTDNRCTGDNEQRCGAVKLCKVAGLGVPLGTSFTFNWSDPGPHPLVTIPAGPAPGGNCVMGKLPIGTTVTIQETNFAPLGDAVANIDVTPASSIVTPPGINLPAGTVTVKVNTGVTEVTYTDHSLKAGYLEICKQGVAGAAPMSGNFTFTIPSGVPGSVTVKPGFCSPPIEVWAGHVTILEIAPSGTIMTTCSSFPPGTLIHCNPNTPPHSGGSVTVNVAPGSLSTQTVVTVTNEYANGSNPK